MRRLTCPPSAEVIGQNIHAFVDNLQGKDTLPIMQRHGLVNLEPFNWYPLVNLMEALNEIAETSESTASMVAIGMEIAKVVPMPPEMPEPTLEQVLMVWDGVYQSIHRNGDVGSIICEKLDDQHFKTIHTDLYPDDFTYGIVYGYAQRFLPRGTDFKVFYDPLVTPRDSGGDQTIVHVSWK